MHQYHLVSEPATTPTTTAMDADAVMAGLNEAQQEAVRAVNGPVLIVAGPGSGKTRTLTHRIAYLLATRTARPSQVLAITFTNKAAREMRSRTDRLVGGDLSRYMTIGTFHATFARILRREATALGFTSDFSIYDTDDTQRALRELMGRFNIDPKQNSPRAMYGLISSAKNRMIGPAEYARLAVGLAQEKAATLYAPYQELLRRSNAMDFDDLLLKPIELFRGHPDVLERYRDRWRFVHVDEYQDTNHAQYTITRLLADGHRNLCVVGDDAQSIYAFRGADIDNILSFQRDYPEATVVRLEQNYRSSKTIVRLADRIIKGNSRQLEKKLWTDNEEGEPVLVLEALSERDEAQKVERRIRDLCLRRGLRYSEVAVLYRTNAQSRSLEESFRREDVPYRIVGGVSFYQRREIKDAIAYLRMVVNPDDGGSLRRIINVPTRGIGNRSQETLFAFADREGIGTWEAMHRLTEIDGLGGRAVKAISAFRDMLAKYVAEAETAPAGDLARSLIHESGLVEDLMREHTPENLVRRENISELVSAIQEFTENPDTPETLSAFLQEVSLLTDADLGGDDDDRVTLMTMHASKGLEFPAVFVTGLEEGLFPLSAAAQDPVELEEERRLFYVGSTRAERHLYLSFARTRYRYGEQQSCVRSRFLDELDGDLLQNEAGGRFEPRKDRFTLGPSTEVRYDGMDPHYYRRSLRPDAQPQQRVAAVPKKTGGEQRIVYDEEHTGQITEGMRVEHSLFGEGEVVTVEGTGPQAKATVHFAEVGPKKLILRFARLRRIG